MSWGAYAFAVLCDRVEERSSRRGDRLVFTVEGHDDPDCPKIDHDRVTATEISLDEWTGGAGVPTFVAGEDGTQRVLLAEYHEPWPCSCVPADAVDRLVAAAQSVPAAISGDAPGQDVPSDAEGTVYPETQTWRASEGQTALLARLLADLSGLPEAVAIGAAVRAEGPTPTWQSVRRATENLLALRNRIADDPTPPVNPGRYALECGTPPRLRFFRWAAPTSGRNKGRIRLVEEIGARTRLVADPAAVLSLIAEAGEDECGMRYATNRVRCFRCGVGLTDPVSRARGLGPDCAKKWGRTPDRKS